MVQFCCQASQRIYCLLNYETYILNTTYASGCERSVSAIIRFVISDDKTLENIRFLYFAEIYHKLISQQWQCKTKRSGVNRLNTPLGVRGNPDGHG